MLSCLLLLVQLGLQLIQLGLEALGFLLALPSLGLKGVTNADWGGLVCPLHPNHGLALGSWAPWVFSDSCILSTCTKNPFTPAPNSHLTWTHHTPPKVHILQELSLSG